MPSVYRETRKQTSECEVYYGRNTPGDHIRIVAKSPTWRNVWAVLRGRYQSKLQISVTAVDYTCDPDAFLLGGGEPGQRVRVKDVMGTTPLSPEKRRELSAELARGSRPTTHAGTALEAYARQVLKGEKPLPNTK